MASRTTETRISDPGKQLLLVSLLRKDNIISNNGKAFLKELILRRDHRLGTALSVFEARASDNSKFLEKIHELILEESRSFYDDLFVDTSLEVGKTLSKEDRDRQNLNSEKSLIYGEVDYNSFYRVLRKIKPTVGSTFYDLGSGTAKAVFAARFTQDFGRCVGIEILPSLHMQAKVIHDRFHSEYKAILSAGQRQDAAVFMGSFLDYDWSDGDVVFANSTCFDDELMEQMSEQANNMQPGAFFVTFTKGLTSKNFEVLERKRYRMSWGPATVYIHRRLGLNGKSVDPHFKLNTLPSDNIEYDDEENGAGSSPALDEDEEDEEEEEGDEEEEEEGDEEEDEDEDVAEEYSKDIFDIDVDENDEDDEDDEDYEDEGEEDDDEDDDDDDDYEDEDDDDDDEDEDEDYEEEQQQQQQQRDPRFVMGRLPPAFGTTLPPPVPASASAAGATAWRPPAAATDRQYSLQPPSVTSPGGASAGPASSSSSGRALPRHLQESSWLNSPQDSALLMRKRVSRS